MAIAFDSNSFKYDVNQSVISWSHTCSGSDRILIVYSHSVNNYTTDSITYNGTALTKIADIEGYFPITSAWYLINPSTGANTIQITFSGPNATKFGMALSYTGVNQTTPINAYNVSGPTAVTTYTNSVTNTVDNCWNILFGNARSTLLVTASAGTTLRDNRSNTFNPFGGDSNGPTTPAGAKSLGITCSSQEVAGINIALAPSILVSFGTVLQAKRYRKREILGKIDNVGAFA